MGKPTTTNNQGGEAWEAELEKLLVYELGAFWSEIAFLEAIPKEKGHHQGFSPTSLIEDNAKVIASRIAPIVAKAKKDNIPMGASQWLEYGKKYGYYDYFLAEARNHLDGEGEGMSKYTMKQEPTMPYNKTLEEGKPKFNYHLTINELDTNTKMRVRYTRKAAELWDWLTTRGYVALIPYDGFGYFYKFADLKAGLKKAYELGLTQKGGLFYEERYYF